MIIGSLVLLTGLLIGAFSLGWIKRGEIESGKMAEALEKAITDEAKKQEMIHAAAVINIAEQTRLEVEAEFKNKTLTNHITSQTDDPICYDDIIVNLINGAR